MLLLKGLECLLLLLLAGPARRVSAEFSCDRNGWLEDESACRKEEVNAVFGAKVDNCNGYLYHNYNNGACDASAAAINGHDDYDGPVVGCYYRIYTLKFDSKADCDKGAPKIEAIIQASKTECVGKETDQDCGNGNCNSNGICVSTTTDTATATTTTTLSTTTVTTTTTTQICNGKGDPLDCQTKYAGDCNSTVIGAQVQESCRVMCGTCTAEAMPTTTTTIYDPDNAIDDSSADYVLPASILVATGAAFAALL